MKIGDAFFTPWHPIRYKGAWKFANQLGKSNIYECENVYNVVMESHHHTPLIGAVFAAPLGHGIREHVVKHDFWGEAVLAVLKSKPGYNAGIVELPADATTTSDYARHRVAVKC